MNPTSRLQASMLLLLIGAAYFFGITLFIWACFVCATVYIVRRFAALSRVPWVSLLVGIAVPGVFSLLVSVSSWLGSMVLAKWARDVNPLDLPDALQVLTCVYVFSLGLCLLAAMVDMLGILAVVSWLKSAFNRQSYHNSWASNPLINATSVVVLGGFLTVAATSSLEITIIKDFKVAEEDSKNSGLQPASLEEAERGLDSSLALAIAAQAHQDSSVCPGLGEEDKVGILPGGRALVRYAVTFHPDKWSESTLLPVGHVDIVDCSRPHGEGNGMGRLAPM